MIELQIDRECTAVIRHSKRTSIIKRATELKEAFEDRDLKAAMFEKGKVDIWQVPTVFIFLNNIEDTVIQYDLFDTPILLN